MPVHTGEDARSARETNQGSRAARDLVEYIKKFGQNISCDNFFTKLSLVQKFFLKKFTQVETMKKNKTEPPRNLQWPKNRM